MVGFYHFNSGELSEILFEPIPKENHKTPHFPFGIGFFMLKCHGPAGQASRSRTSGQELFQSGQPFVSTPAAKKQLFDCPAQSFVVAK